MPYITLVALNVIEIELNTAQRQRNIDFSVWLRLSKLKQSGLTLGNAAATRLNKLSEANPSWKLRDDQREEFPIWIIRGEGPDKSEIWVDKIAPSRDLGELTLWIRNTEHLLTTSSAMGSWYQLCRHNYKLCYQALKTLAEENFWSEIHWRVALHVCSNEKEAQRWWKQVAEIVYLMPIDKFRKISDSVAWWLNSMANSIRAHEDIFVKLCSRIVEIHSNFVPNLTQEAESIENAIVASINHPVGLVTNALISNWLKQKPNDNELLPTDICTTFTEICNPKVGGYREGRLVLGSNLTALYRVDQNWTKQNLLPLFQWQQFPDEAPFVWQGLLRAPRIHLPLIIEIKDELLETVKHYLKLGNVKEHYANFLTVVAVERVDGIESSEFKAAFNRLPKEGLEETARTLERTLDSTDSRRVNYWTNRMKPFLQEIWPMNNKLTSEQISEHFALLCIVSGDLFPDVLETVSNWLKPIEHPLHVVNQLFERDLCAQFPDESLKLLDKIIESPEWSPLPLAECLNAISTEKPNLEKDYRHMHLKSLASDPD